MMLNDRALRLAGRFAAEAETLRIAGEGKSGHRRFSMPNNRMQLTGPASWFCVVEVVAAGLATDPERSAAEVQKQ